MGIFGQDANEPAVSSGSPVNATTSPSLGPIPGAGGGAADSMPGMGNAGASQDMIKQILGRLMRPRTGLATPTPAPIPERQGYEMKKMGSPMGEVGELLYNIGAAVNNGVAQHKEKQLRSAMADYSTLQSAWESAEEMAGGDVQKARQMFSQDPRVQAVMTDPKKMKNMAKAMSQDLLHPEKTTVYGEALKRHLEAQKAKDQVREARRFKKLWEQNKIQLSEQQRQQQTKELAYQLPLKQTQTDPKIMEQVLSIEQKAQETNARIQEMRERTETMRNETQQRLDMLRDKLADQKLAEKDRTDLERQRLGIEKEMNDIRMFETMVRASEVK